MTYTYDGQGRMASAIWPSGKTQHWQYGHKWNLAIEHPVKFWVDPGLGSDHGEKRQVTCYDVDPISGQVRYSLTAEGIPEEDLTGDGSNDEPSCHFFLDGKLKPEATETVFGWMTAAPSSDPDRQTVDDDLESYLDRWVIEPRGLDPPLAFRGTGQDQATWPWLSPIEERGRAAMTVVGADGELQADRRQRALTRYTYDTQGALTESRIYAVEDADGDGTVDAAEETLVRREILTYLEPGMPGPSAGSATATGNLAQRRIEDAAGNLLGRERMKYDGWSHVIETRTLLAASPEQEVVQQRSFDFRGRLLSEKTTDETGTEVSGEVEYHYDAAGRTTEKRILRDDDGSTRTWSLVEYSYSPEGLVLSEQAWATALGDGADWSGDGSSTETRYAYDPFGNVTRVSVRLADGQWRVDTKQYDKLSRVTQATAYFSAAVDGDSLPTSSGSQSVRTWYVPSGEPGAGQPQWTQVQGSDGKAGRTEKVEYDRLDRPIRKKVCLEATVPQGNDSPTCTTWLSETELFYDQEDRVVESKVYGSESDSGGIDQLLGWSRAVYDARGRAYEKQVAQAAQAVVPADPQWLATRTGYDALDRAVTAATPDGSGGWNVSTVEYDALGRKVKATDAAGNELLLTRNVMGLVTRRKVKENGSDPGGGSSFETDFEYDALGRVVRVLLADPVSGEPTRPVTRSYDVQSRVIAQWLPGNSAASGEAYKTETVYDGLGRKVQVRKHSGLSVHTDGWQEVFSDYDAGGRLTAIRVDPDGSGPAAEQQTRYEYDAQGRQTLRIMPDGREQRTGYDSLSRVAKTIYASASGTCNSGGTACVELASTWDQAGRRTALTASLDGADPAHYNLTAGATQTQRWRYDGLGRILETRDDNAAGADAVVSYSYDTLSRVLTSGWGEAAGGGALWTVRAGYDSAGRLESVQYPSVAAPHYAGPTLRYGYDALQRVTTLTDLHGAGPEDDEQVIEATYTGATRLRELKHSDGTVWRSHDGSQELRDAAGRSTGAQVVAPAVGDVWFEEQISYDDNDRVTRVAWPHGRIAAGESEA
ncbi:MAG: hypothetical protein Q9Q40_07895, partial [Acidobacteriota bacterium]|nr:hypothetical protein [Acidobacteriota bacterium]